MIKKLRALFAKLDIHTAQVVKKSLPSTIVKISGMVIGLGISVFLGRTIGAEGLGIINLANRIVMILMIIGLLGMQQVIIKNISIAYNKSDFKRIADVLHTSYLINGGIAFIITILSVLFAPWVTTHVFHEQLLKWPLIIAIIVMGPQIFTKIFSSGFVGFRKIWQSNLVDQTLTTLIVGLVLVIFMILSVKITVILVAFAYALGRIAATIISGVYWHKIYTYRGRGNFIGKNLLKMALPMFVVNATTLVSMNAPFILLGWLSNANQVGLYSVSSRLAFMIVFFLHVVGTTISPKIAALYENGRIEEIEIMMKKVTIGLTIIGISGLVFFIVFGNLILSIWGTEFIEAYKILIVLSFGQFISGTLSAAGLILIMTGFEKTQSHISISFLFLNLILSYLLIKHYGAIGAAISTAITISGDSITRIIFVKIKVGIITIPWFGEK